MRLDQLLVEKYGIKSRSRAASLIMLGDVTLKGVKMTKPGVNVKESDASFLEIKKQDPYVGFGAYKLLQAFESFKISVQDCICIDIGASTGGFTQVLLEKGAKLVYAIDVGENQLDYSLRIDNRIVVYEKTNARNLDITYFNKELPTFFVIDVSFISLKLIFPTLSRLNIEEGVALIKPQFEVGREIKNFDGIIKEEKYHHLAIEKVIEYAKNEGYQLIDCVLSPSQKDRKNKEFLAYFKKEKGE